MKVTNLFTKSQKKSRQYDSINATLLIKGGFIDQTMAGVYSFLPLGWKVLTKIENIIRSEMNTIGQEMFMPAVVPKSLWETTKRIDSVDVLAKVMPANDIARANNNAEYILNPTHEDVVTPIAQKFAHSYKDFPFAVYHIQTKFRNEPRPKSGLLRCREFRMKDLYSFHISEKDLQKYYETAKRAYIHVFEKLGLGKDTVIALASGGDFTQDYSHEFQTICDTGEDMIFYANKKKIYYNKEVAPAIAPPVQYKDAKKLAKKDVKGVGIIGVEDLSSFLKIPVEKTTKTILFETDQKKVVAAAVRGNYDVNTIKLRKIVGCKSLKLASEKVVKKVTGAQIGYAGPLNLPKPVSIYYDDSMKGRINFECGANKTNYHTINVNFGRDVATPATFYDIKVAQKGDIDPETKKPYKVYRASEVGNIFPLNTKFSEAFSYRFVDQKGKMQPVYMGSYGIGSSRIMGVLVEKFHDEKGIIWPKAVAPFAASLIALGDKKIFDEAEKLHTTLTKQGIEILFDDRTDVSAGEKFADADLIGNPFRLVLSPKTKGKIEIKKREESAIELVNLNKAIALLK